MIILNLTILVGKRKYKMTILIDLTILKHLTSGDHDASSPVIESVAKTNLLVNSTGL